MAQNHPRRISTETLFLRFSIIISNEILLLTYFESNSFVSIFYCKFLIVSIFRKYES